MIQMKYLSPELCVRRLPVRLDHWKE